MLNNTLRLGSLIFFISGVATTQVNAADDQLSSLITKVSSQAKSDAITDVENKLLGRASWKIKCQYKAFDDIKACVMSKGPISVLHLNNQYIVNIGEKHEKNSIAYVRIDQGNTLQEREGLFRNANGVIGQLKRGNFAFTRYQKAKNQQIENKISLTGFTDAFNDMEAQFSKLGDDKNKF
ncbi:hypothetical protein [Acinetobacter sp. Marseille-Q1618]|uniref:hypothetical protein n=1 Tax=Acinetobacter sp. Marseille-Q1618 TaxID=2697502 RepID=UPI0020C33901|nr:hypothetical protein [Acinetobacter sp. Marseille-Q1618]